MVGHGSILAFDQDTDIRELCTPPAGVRRRRELRQVLPVPDRAARAVRDVRGAGDIDREKLEALLETLELGSLCAHGGGMPAPIRS